MTTPPNDGDDATPKAPAPRVPPSSSPDGAKHRDNPSHVHQGPFFQRLQMLMRAPVPGDPDSNHPIPLLREAIVPAELLQIDGLFDLHGSMLAGGLFHLLRPWCEGRVVCIEWTSRDMFSLRSLRTSVAKATMATTGRRQDVKKWRSTCAGERITLMIVGDHARPEWFSRWQLPFEQQHPGVWVLETELITLVVVRPRLLGTVPGGHLWGLLPTFLSRRRADSVLDALLGDTLTARFMDDVAVELLQHRFPEMIPMPTSNAQQVQDLPQEPQPPGIPKSYWRAMKENADNARRLRALEQELDATRAAAAAAQRTAEEERVRAEELAAEVARLRGLLGRD